MGLWDRWAGERGGETGQGAAHAGRLTWCGRRGGKGEVDQGHCRTTAS